jgi:hypothetical protein
VWVFFGGGPNKWKSLKAKSGCKVDVQELLIAAFELSPGLLGLHGVWHHDKAATLLPVGLDIFCELHPKASTELHSMMQNSHFHKASKIS